MPSIRVYCPMCSTEVEIDAQHAGAEVECGSCFRVFVVEAPRSRGTKPYDTGAAGAGDEPRAVRSRPRHVEDDDEYEELEPPRSRSVYIILAIVFFGMGVHNFYAGRTGPGVAQLVIWLVSWPLMFVLIGCVTIFIPGIWALIDIVAVTTDGNGRRMV